MQPAILEPANIWESTITPPGTTPDRHPDPDRETPDRDPVMITTLYRRLFRNGIIGINQNGLSRDRISGTAYSNL